MRKIFSRVAKPLSAFLCLIFLLTCSAGVVFAGVDYQNQTTGYRFVIEDEAELFSNNTEDEMQDLMRLMNEITDSCNVALVTIDDNPYVSTESYARYKNEELFGSSTNNAVIFVIDMDERMLLIDSMGSTRKTITSSYCNTITDNVYRYASDGDYYTCAYETFDQIQTLLAGRRIAQPMKYICNVFLAIVLAMLINFFVVRISCGKKKASSSEVLSGIFQQVNTSDFRADFINQTKTYSPQSSGGSGGGGGGGHSGGGGGGHSSGGHRF